MQVILNPQHYLANNRTLAMETLRIYRPRIVIHGPVGMGQNYIGTAALHHLEGYHVQNLDLGTLLSDSTRVSLYIAAAELTLTISPLLDD
jgi:SpoVK/Ycf46/Vps4 family AAA+-type ATPase